MNVSDCGKLFLPDELRVHMVQNREAIRTWSRNQAPILTAGAGNFFQNELSREGFSTCVFPLFYSDIHYGVFMVSIHPEDMLFYYTLSLEIGTGLRYLYMAMDQQEARKTLEQQNRILDYSASHDALTGLYNRVAVINQIYSFVREHGRGSQFAAVMADIDHLKQINDTFGHNAGDEAIQAATELLRAALPEGSPLGRTGGDEFTGLFAVRNDFTADDFKRRLSELCRIYNEQSDKPWYEELSAGCMVFSFDESDDILQHFKQADAELYKAKKHRRTSVVRMDKMPQ
jgi:diguanylate cyclase (GGDEF)-like protein